METNHTTFLEDIAEKLINDFSFNFENCVVILPNKRARLFLQEAIKNKTNSFVISPKIISIEDFISELASMKKIDPLEGIFEFYQVYLEMTPIGNRQDFETFSGWAKMLMQDFNEVDTYLLKPDHVFSYLKNIDDINHWAVDSNQRTEMIQNYLTFWDMMPVYYRNLTQHLFNKNKGYQGMIYREAVNKLDDFINKDDAETMYYFCGFNALNQAEEVIIQKLLSVNKARLFWNIDEFFLNDPEHDAGYFARKIKRNWSYYKSYPFETIGKQYSEPKRIEIIATPKSVGQARIVGEIVENVSQSKKNLQNVAVVLSDENLLLPVLNSLPSSVEALNITMGFQSKTHPIQLLIQKILKMQNNALQRKNTPTFYHKEVLEILTHPLVISLSNAQQLVNYIHTNNVTFFSWNTIQNFISEKDSFLFAIMYPWKDLSIEDIINKLFLIIDTIKGELVTKEDHVSLAFAYTVYQTIKKIQNYQELYQFIHSLNHLVSIYKQVVDLMEVSFEGEPLQGLQVMGILESRVLDFDTVIITSLNEGKFPSGKTNNSFIPFDVKLELGLPTYKEKDAIFTYHFYHLMHRAKNVFLLYNSDQDGRDAAEKSRFITQLLLEHPKSHHIIQNSYFAQLPTDKVELKSVKKSDDLLDRLREIAEGKGFSPSSLANYLRNPMQFYLQRVLSIRDIDEVEENIALNTLGTIVHNTLEDLYRPLLGKVLNLQIVDDMITNVPEILDFHFKEVYSKTNDRLGKNLLAMEVARQNVMFFLEKEKEDIQAGSEVIVLSLEEELSVVVKHADLPYPVKIAGKADRIEKRNGVVRIIDYKTGKVLPNDVKLKSFDDLLDGVKYEKVIQLLCYALMSKSKYPSESINVGIYSFKNKKEGYLLFDWDKNGPLITDEILHLFTEKLVELLKEILNKEIDFIEKEI